MDSEENNEVEEMEMEVVKTKVKRKEKKGYPCPHEGCKAAFSRPYRLSEHLFVHFNYKAYRCTEPACDKSYTNRSHLTRHINTAHRSVPAQPRTTFSCPSCIKSFSNSQNLKRHVKEYHSPDSTRSPMLSCDHCKAEFRTRNLLCAHMFIHSGIKSFRCDCCSKEFVSHNEKRKHMRAHKTYECPDCPMKFNLYAKFLEHKQNNHKREEYKCEECGMTFKQRCYLLRHIRTHVCTKVFHCPYEGCQRYYTRNSNLKQHIMVRHLNFTYNCTICPAQLSTKAKLDYHMNLHNGPKKEKPPPKTKATGRKPRFDKGEAKSSTALKISGLPEALVEVCMD
ncbi:zinc finger protein 492-like isoform X2 [Plodia interpunctella]|nr:zinc finger protein 492-like isoform X2 [Plodia interpunctella]